MAKYNPFNKIINWNAITDEERYYPFASKEAHDAAVDDTLSIATDVFGSAGKAMFKFIVSIKGALQGSDFLDDLKGGIRRYLSRITDTVLDSLDIESIKVWGGKFTAKVFNEQLRQRTGQESPIDNFYSPTIAEEFGEWFAKLANQKASEQLGYEVHILNTVYPADTIKTDIDAFMTAELNTRLNLHVTSVLTDKKQLVNEIKTEVIGKIEKEMVMKLAEAKNKVMLDASLYTGMTQTEMMIAVRLTGALFERVLEEFSVTKIFGYNVSAINYYHNNKARIYNANRQRRFRQTHHEERQWVEN